MSNQSWDPKDVRDLREARKSGMSFQQIKESLFPHRSVKALNLRCAAKDTTKFMWSPARDNKLLSMLNKLGKKEIAAQLGTTPQSISDRLCKLGVRLSGKRITSKWVHENTGVSTGTIAAQKRKLKYPYNEHLTVERAIELITHLKHRNVQTSMLRLNTAIRMLQDMA